MTRAEEKYIKYFDDDFNYPNVLQALKSLENEMQEEIEQLKQQNEKMRNCVNCKNMIKGTRDVCNDCFKSKDFRHWEIAE